MPRMGTVVNKDMGEIVFPSPQGGYMWRSTWSSWWKAICAAAGMAGQDFYDLKHRAIQWMVNPSRRADSASTRQQSPKWWPR